MWRACRPGIYTVRAEKERFQTQVLEGIALSSGAAIVINLSLRVGTVPQDVTVSADIDDRHYYFDRQWSDS